MAKNRKNALKASPPGPKSAPWGMYQQKSDGTVSISFDLSKAPIPSNVYSASLASFVDGDNHEAFLNFIKIDANRSYRNYIRVRLDDIAVLNFWRNSKDFYEMAGAWYENTYGKKPVATRFSDFDKLGSLHAVEMSANLIFMAHQENTAVMDFYFFDPRAAREMTMGSTPASSIATSPVVEVRTNTYVVWNLLDQVSAYVEKTLRDNPHLQAKIKEP